MVIFKNYVNIKFTKNRFQVIGNHWYKIKRYASLLFLVFDCACRVLRYWFGSIRMPFYWFVHSTFTVTTAICLIFFNSFIYLPSSMGIYIDDAVHCCCFSRHWATWIVSYVSVCACWLPVDTNLNFRVWFREQMSKKGNLQFFSFSTVSLMLECCLFNFVWKLSTLVFFRIVKMSSTYLIHILASFFSFFDFISMLPMKA